VTTLGKVDRVTVDVEDAHPTVQIVVDASGLSDTSSGELVWLDYAETRRLRDLLTEALHTLRLRRVPEKR